MNSNIFNIPAYHLMQNITSFEQGPDNQIYQCTFIEPPKFEQGTAPTFELPLNKALKGSIQFVEDRSCQSGKRFLQTIRFYRSNGKRYSTSIYDTRHAHVKVSQSRLTLNMSIPLPDDPQRLTARLQNFANILIEESDEIAAMLSLEGTTKVQDAWGELAREEETGGLQ